MGDESDERELQEQRDRYSGLRGELPSRQTTAADTSVAHYLASVRVSGLCISALATIDRIERLERIRIADHRDLPAGGHDGLAHGHIQRCLAHDVADFGQ